MKWTGYSNIILQNYRKQEHTAYSLANLLCSNGIEMLVMKGIALAHLYPCPENRSFGDLDIKCHEEGAQSDIYTIPLQRMLLAQVLSSVLRIDLPLTIR